MSAPRRNGKAEPRRLRLVDFSDREFLLILDDVARHDPDGWAESVEIAARIDDSEDVHRSVAIRCSWLMRYGALEREHERDDAGNLRWRKGGEPKYTQRWRLTPAGAALAKGKLKRAAENALEGLRDDEMLVATRILTSRYRNASEVAGTLVRREWTYGTAKERFNGRG